MRSIDILALGFGAALVVAQAPGPLSNDPKWAYEGCYTSPPGHILDWFVKQNLSSAVDVTLCLSKCTTRYAALGAGSCYCSTTIPPTLTSSPTSANNCTFPCAAPGSSTQACGGPMDTKTFDPTALSLYDSTPASPITYPNWEYQGCLAHLSEMKEANLTHIATIKEITVEGCLRACDVAGLNAVYAGLSGGLCYCAPSPPNDNLALTFVPNAICSTSCLGNPLESCGGPFLDADPALSLYKRISGPADPKITAGVFTGSGVLITRTTTISEAGKTGGANGAGGVKTASGTGSGVLATGTGKNSAGRNGDVAMGGLLGVLVGLVWI